MSRKTHHIDTALGHLGLSPDTNFGIPNPPIYRTSTILSSSMAQHRGDLPKAYDYGRIGTPTSAAFEGAVAALYGAEACISTPSGLSAITHVYLICRPLWRPCSVSGLSLWVFAPVRYHLIV